MVYIVAPWMYGAMVGSFVHHLLLFFLLLQVRHAYVYTSKTDTGGMGYINEQI